MAVHCAEKQDEISGAPEAHVEDLPEETFIAKYLKGKPLAEIVMAYGNGIKRYARQGEFGKAEKLRERLIAVAPTAVAEIVQTAEIIEREKTASMDYERIKPWAGLFNTFTPGEAAEFYYALKEVNVKARQSIFRQGNCDNRLYFIASGKFKLSYFAPQEKKTVVFAEVGPRHICGVETFFTHMTHSTNLVAIEDSHILFLTKQEYQKLVSKHPAIQSKLITFCEKYQLKFEHLKKMDNPARRAHPRFQIALKGEIHRIDSKGSIQPSGLEMTVADISVGGLSFKIPRMGLSDAAGLHLSIVRATVYYRKFSITHQFSRMAKVVAVRFLPFGECSVHLQFQDPLEEGKVFDIAKHTNVTAFL